MKIGKIYQQIIGCALFSIKDFRNRIELESFKASSHIYDFSVLFSSSIWIPFVLQVKLF